MTYTDCVDYFMVKALAVSPDCTFIHGKKADSSLISSSTIYPIIWLAPFSETVDRIKGNIERQITIAFFAQDSTNNTLIQRQGLIQSMWELKESFMSSLEDSIPMVGQVSNERAVPEYSWLAGYVSGYAVTFKFSTKTLC